MNALRWTAIILLLLLGLGGLAGGITLILDPSGHMLRMPIELLRYSPFRTFLIPGIILLCANGLLPLVIVALAWRQSRNYALWTAFSGATLFVWIVVECLFLRAVEWPHYLYGGWGLVLFFMGVAIWAARRRADASPASVNH